MMKLSEAIRLGAMLRPQAIGKFKTQPGRGRKAATCALGAAYEALGIQKGKRQPGDTVIMHRGGGPPSEYTWEIPEALFVFLQSEQWCPQCVTRGPVGRMIPHLNDTHLWTRERIADWVATIEPQEQPAPVSCKPRR